MLLQVVEFARCWPTDRLNIALVVSLHVCFTGVMNSCPSQGGKKTKTAQGTCAHCVSGLSSGPRACAHIVGKGVQENTNQVCNSGQPGGASSELACGCTNSQPVGVRTVVPCVQQRSASVLLHPQVIRLLLQPQADCSCTLKLNALASVSLSVQQQSACESKSSRPCVQQQSGSLWVQEQSGCGCKSSQLGVHAVRLGVQEG